MAAVTASTTDSYEEFGRAADLQLGILILLANASISHTVSHLYLSTLPPTTTTTWLAMLAWFGKVSRGGFGGSGPIDRIALTLPRLAEVPNVSNSFSLKWPFPGAALRALACFCASREASRES